MIRRTVQRYRIVARTRTHPYRLSNRDDFELVYQDALLGGLPANALPYCVDRASERLLFVTVDDIEGTLRAPFVYGALYDGARSLIACPLERTFELESAQVKPPLLVFSIGRCGSTLLSHLLNQAGYLSISEPDAFCGFAFLKQSQVPEMGLDLIGHGVRASLRSFEQHAGSAVAIKFRSQCNRAIGLYQRVLPEGRFVFMLRKAESWAGSVHRAFDEPTTVMVRRLANGIAAYDRLVESGCGPNLIWYEDLKGEPGRVLQTLIGRELTIDEQDAIRAAMQRDAQAGTTLDQTIVRSRQTNERIMADFRAAWSMHAPYNLIEKHGLQRLL